MTKKTIFRWVQVFIVLLFVGCDFWKGYHQERSIPLGLLSALGALLSLLLGRLFNNSVSEEIDSLNKPDKDFGLL
jgi:hypothetical protein